MERDPAPVYRAPPAAPAHPHITDDPRHPAPDDLRARRAGTPAGGTGEHTGTARESATALAAPGRADPVPVGRPHILDPDVVERIAAGVAWTPIRGKDYHYGSGPHGYADLPRHDAVATLRSSVSTSENIEE